MINMSDILNDRFVSRQEVNKWSNYETGTLAAMTD